MHCRERDRKTGKGGIKVIAHPAGASRGRPRAASPSLLIGWLSCEQLLGPSLAGPVYSVLGPLLSSLRRRLFWSFLRLRSFSLRSLTQDRFKQDRFKCDVPIVQASRIMLDCLLPWFAESS